MAQPGARSEMAALCEALGDWVDKVVLIPFGFVMGRIRLAFRDRNLRPEDGIRVTSA